jgi:hypothetical protein
MTRLLFTVFAAQLLFPGLTAGAAEFNGAVLRMINRMPRGGGYATDANAKQNLASAVLTQNERVAIQPEGANPSFCSSATYLVFAGVLSELAQSGQIHLPADSVAALEVTGQPDGSGVWGRWNANGPGTARLFYETGLGSNFVDWARARPGDFMKIFWTREIGSRERGHSVVFLGTELIDGVEHVRFWSSNKPEGYGEKTVPRTKIAWAVFSRLERPARVSRLAALPKMDTYLASMLKRPSTQAEVAKVCGF